MDSESGSPAKAWSAFPGDLHDAIRSRAEEIYVRNGKIPGRDVENWMQAEEEILREAAARDVSGEVSNAIRRAIVIRVNGVEYVGEYTPSASDGYAPGEFAGGKPIPVRFEGNRMFVQRPNGKELETTLVRKTG